MLSTGLAQAGKASLLTTIFEWRSDSNMGNCRFGILCSKYMKYLTCTDMTEDSTGSVAGLFVSDIVLQFKTEMSYKGANLAVEWIPYN